MTPFDKVFHQDKFRVLNNTTASSNTQFDSQIGQCGFESLLAEMSLATASQIMLISKPEWNLRFLPFYKNFILILITLKF